MTTDWGVISLGVELAGKVTVVGKGIVKIIEKLSKKKPRLEGPCKLHLLHGLGMIEQGRRKNNMKLIQGGVEALDTARTFSNGGTDNACFFYGMATGYLLLGERTAAFKAIEGINGELTPYQQIKDLRKYLIELTNRKVKNKSPS